MRQKEELWGIIKPYNEKKSPKPYLNFLINIRLDWLVNTKGTLSNRAPKLVLFLQ